MWPHDGMSGERVSSDTTLSMDPMHWATASQRKIAARPIPFEEMVSITSVVFYHVQLLVFVYVFFQRPAEL